ncbi:Uma2 family endonuclease [Kitasatospora purpeofusca]|uniref:Uma2 family endonuclease n=1 Tax=Kitasatospora purpeofusca TaxID=67352 RepID=UPI002258787B|nr:Uma2 family endonuclease [Kitasatospora purpeofusca]MCX4758075.1 Uma2 family endonuclease [Kitasatospora purpeofusca]WSR37155.1 Uma2 family endonuclease [Kitasatospora purpeofusca]WSR45390.1 Uma2 family endonuclease [Kitasatospora purpeofusca]
MSAAAVEDPFGQPTLLEAAELIASRLTGHRVEIIGGQITVTPPADGPHGEVLTDLMVPLLAAGLHRNTCRVVQAIGLWLPGGPSDYAVPDLSVVDADYRDHLIEHNSYDPAVFRLVAEVTSSNYMADVKIKPMVYADAGIPVYLIVDRRNLKVMVLTDPQGGEYRVHAVHHPGQSFALPESIGAAVTLSVDEVLAAKK